MDPSLSKMSASGSIANGELACREDSKGGSVYEHLPTSVKIRLVLAFSTFSLIRPDIFRPLILHVWCGRWNLQDAVSL